MQRLERIFEDSQGELSTANEEQYSYMIDLLQNKTDDFVEFIRKQEDLIEVAKSRLKQYQDYLKARENKIYALENYCIACMNKLNVDRFEGQLNEIKKRKPVQVVKILDENKIPPEFVTIEQTISVNKSKLKNALKNGDVEGAELIDSPNVSLMFNLKRG